MTGTSYPATAYKILTAAQWAQFQADGVFQGAPVDLADGYIHLSAADQLLVDGVRPESAGRSPRRSR